MPTQEPDERLRLNGYVEKVIARSASTHDKVLREVAAITETDYFRTLSGKGVPVARGRVTRRARTMQLDARQPD